MIAIIALVLLFPIISCNGKHPLVTTPFGAMKGTTMVSRLNKTFHAFRGIRYAKAERFKDSQMVTHWDGTYEAIENGPVCPQPTNEPVSEDCLFLNVYTKGKEKSNTKSPVIVRLHPGGFYVSSGSSDWSGPHYLMDQDIVLVTLNYRLGSLGFLSVGKEAPGNFGLKDQVVALKWIQKNIASFGGDPGNVVLFGYSAGSWSITLHMVSPLTKNKGLFHKAIISSGSALGHWPLPHHQQLDVAKKQARLLGCPDDTPSNIVECLKTKPAEDLGNSFSGFQEFSNNPILIWSPVIEGDYGQERYMPQNPIKYYAAGDYQKLPVVIGRNKDETGYMAFQILDNDTLTNEFNNNFEKYAPIAFIYERNTEKSKKVSRAVKKFYLKDRPISNETLTELAKVYADSVIGFPVHRAANLISAKSTEPVFYYDFTYLGRYSYFYLPGSNSIPWGVVHHDDTMYAFYVSKLFPLFNSSFPEARIVEQMTTIWGNFAKTGNPIPDRTPLYNNVKWEPYNQQNGIYMDIGSEMVSKNYLHKDRHDFWESLYPISEYL